MSKAEFTDYYSLLEIPVESDSKVINKAYRKKALLYHPDKNHGNEKASKIDFYCITYSRDVQVNKRSQGDFDG